ncbi:MAG TPA: sigma-70 family RNA polymerase sigma factor [Vicinamibacterales bacterium]
MASSRSQISAVLADWANRDKADRDRLLPLLYEELRRLAHHYMRGERAGHTLQTTALVNEVYVKLAGLERMRWRDRSHFMATVATLMRRILVDYARSRLRDKRGGDLSITSFDEEQHDCSDERRGLTLLALDEALTMLAVVDSRQAQIVEMRFFGGLTVEETGQALGVSVATVKRDWATAKAWLYRAVSQP